MQIRQRDINETHTNSSPKTIPQNNAEIRLCVHQIAGTMEKLLRVPLRARAADPNTSLQSKVNFARSIRRTTSANQQTTVLCLCMCVKATSLLST